MRFLGTRIAIPILLFGGFVFGLYSLLPDSVLRSYLFYVGLALLVFWWSGHIMRWLRMKRAPQALVYLATNLISASVIFFLTALSGVAVAQGTPFVSVILIIGGAIAAVMWLLASVLHLFRTRRRYRFWQRILAFVGVGLMDLAGRQPSCRTARHAAARSGQLPGGTTAALLAGTSSAALKAGAAQAGSEWIDDWKQAPEGPGTKPQPASQKPAAETKSGGLYRPLWMDGQTQAASGARIPARAQPAQPPSAPPTSISAAPPEPGRWELRSPGRKQLLCGYGEKGANERGKRCDFVPFAHYWPTYSDMTPPQYRWYMYWRSELREARLLPTDLSYIFVHVYEAINLVGVPDHASAYRRLVQLWLHYRGAFPKLDNYMPDWIADFIVVQRLGIDPLDWYAFVLQIGAAQRIDPDLVLEINAAGRLPIEKLPPDFLFRLSNYSPRQSKFYRTYAQDLQLDTAYVVGLAAVDAAHRSATQKGLLQSFHSGRAYTLKRAPFLSAVHGYSIPEISIAKVHHWSADPQLGESIGTVLRHTENILRTQSKYRSLLRGVTVPPELGCRHYCGACSQGAAEGRGDRLCRRGVPARRVRRGAAKTNSRR